ncbi:hypothetical protein P4284_24450 [Bacillus swezeyi]|uniref:hypothetical protein n=1 Tax=Bacillus swezeyi TaxID=1925020 RepID=UPI002E250DDD|nr:hypothetical protein [Bacillus swezeyi]MED2979794.1 hypothetical protein [Bacillus swezeyi]
MVILKRIKREGIDKMGSVYNQINDLVENLMDLNITDIKQELEEIAKVVYKIDDDLIELFQGELRNIDDDAADKVEKIKSVLY